jgi:hypothetical protein
MAFTTLVPVFGRVPGGNCRPHTTRPPRRFRPKVEILEGRSLPSTFTVTDLGDAGIGSGLQGDLRYAITTANANGDLSNHIQFQPGLTGTITLTQGALTITKNLEIDGPGQDLLTVSGNHQSGVFDITAAPNVQDVRFTDLTIADGTGIQSPLQRRGGGIDNDHAALTLTRVTVAGNVLPDQGLGGGIYDGSGALTLESSSVTANQVGGGGLGTAIYNAAGSVTIRDSSIAANVGTSIFTPPTIFCANDSAPLTVSRSTVINNVGDGIQAGTVTVDHSLIAGNGVWGIAANITTVDHSTISGNAGGGMDSSRYLMLTDSTVADNHFNGGIYTSGYAMVSGSTIAGNIATNAGGGFSSAGSGSFAEILNSTITDNTAGGGGGVEVGSADSTIEVISSTIGGNSAIGTTNFYQGGGGIGFYRGGGSQGILIMLNTIVAGNTSATTGPDVDGVVISLNYNFIGAADGSSGWLTHDHTGTSDNPLDPQLGPLQDNGGPTLTYAPLLGSPVNFEGDPGLGGPDQRGSLRSGIFSGTVGAVVASQATSLRVSTPTEVTAGQPFDITVTAVDKWGNTATTYGGTLHFSSNDLGAQLPDDYQFGAADGGSHTFTATLGTPGQQTISIQDVNNAALASVFSVQVDGGLDPLTGQRRHEAKGVDPMAHPAPLFLPGR